MSKYNSYQGIIPLVIFAGLHFSLMDYIEPPLSLLLVLSGLFFAGSLYLSLIKRNIFICISIFMFLLSYAFGTQQLNYTKQAAYTMSENKKISLICEVVSSSEKNKFGYQTQIEIIEGDFRGYKLLLSGNEPYLMGDTLQADGSFQMQKDPYLRSSLAQGVLGTLRVTRGVKIGENSSFIKLLNSLQQSVLNTIQPDISPSRALVAAGFLNYKGPAKSFDIPNSFKQAGLSHLLAVSGVHLIIITKFLDSLLLKFRLKPRMRFICLGLILGIFVMVCQTPLSALRSYAMSLSVFGARSFGRRSHALTTLGIVVFIILLFDYRAAASLGFLLSVSAMIGLIVVAPRIRKYVYRYVQPVDWRDFFPPKLARIARKLEGNAKNAFVSTVAVISTTSWITVVYFHSLNLVTLVSNLFVVPVFSLFLQSSCLGIALGFIPVVNNLLFLIIDSLGALVLGLVMLFSTYQIIAVGAIVFFVLLLGGYMAYKRGIFRYILRFHGKKITLSVLVSIFLLGSISVFWLSPVQEFLYNNFGSPRVCVMDIGQGDSILLQEPGGVNVLFDAAPPDKLKSALKRNHVSHLNAIFVSHLHDDHYAGIIDIAHEYSCDVVYVAEGVVPQMPKALYEATKTLTHKEPVQIKKDQIISVGNYKFKVLWPFAPVLGTINPDSLIVLASYQKDKKCLSVLLTGDAEQDEIQQVVAEYPHVHIDILKVGHHGSSNNIDMASLKKLQPKAALISCGKDNKYGHPTKQCLDVLKQYKVPIFVTKDVGDISVYPEDTGSMKVVTG